MLAAELPDVVPIVHQHGCSQLGRDAQQTLRTLIGIGSNPNVAAVLVVGLGCETLHASKVAEGIARTGKPVAALVIQDEGGTIKTYRKALPVLRKMLAHARKHRRQPCDLSRLWVATECGGSDACSGLAANPAVGAAMDLIIKAGGNVMLSETTEFIGAEHLLARQCASPALGKRLVDITIATENAAKACGVDIRGANPAPGHIQGGITTIEEKSLGCTYKAGTTPIQEVLDYAERPSKRGLVVMDTPGNDVESNIGMLAGGAQIIVFTTGRGSPTGSPIAPVIKVASNSGMFIRMRENMDINAGTIMDGRESIAQVGRRIADMVHRVAEGARPKAERLGHREFGIYRIARTF
jgi:altronate dehydratase large subunit